MGENLFKKGVYGYITVDLIAFPDPSNRNNHPLFWAIGIDCYLNNYGAACLYFYFLVKGSCDQVTGTCILNENESEVNNLESASVK